MITVTNIWCALQHGKEIANPATWKNKQNTVNSLTSLLSIAVLLLKITGVEIPVSDQELLIIATGVATILGAVNSVITTISSSKVGIK